MMKIPVIGAIAEVVTFREYKNATENEKLSADVKVPEISVTNEDGTVNQETTEQINKTIVTVERCVPDADDFRPAGQLRHSLQRDRRRGPDADADRVRG